MVLQSKTALAQKTWNGDRTAMWVEMESVAYHQTLINKAVDMHLAQAKVVTTRGTAATAGQYICIIIQYLDVFNIMIIFLSKMCQRLGCGHFAID